MITDDCYDYTDGVSELARPNVKPNAAMLEVIEPNVGEILYASETESRGDWIARVGPLAVRSQK